jgi:hypothetical protein
LDGENGESIRVIALVDSGSDCACFPLSLARGLGIDLSSCELRTGRTAGGPNDQYWWRPGIRGVVAGHQVHFTGVFTDTPFALLGRQDFFRAFAVTFDQRTPSFTLTRYEDEFAVDALVEDGELIDLAEVVVVDTPR